MPFHSHHFLQNQIDYQEKPAFSSIILAIQTWLQWGHYAYRPIIIYIDELIYC